MLVVKLADLSQLDSLLSPEQYLNYLQGR
jgi:hypothetical protein